MLISYLAGCMGHKAFALHYCCWQSRAKKMDDLFVVLPSFLSLSPRPILFLAPALMDLLQLKHLLWLKNK